MEIRKAQLDDIGAIMAIFADAREYMHHKGNPNQWRGKWGEYPSQSLIEEDIARGKSYVCHSDGQIVCTFYFAVEDDPTYQKIEGAWLSDAPYGVVHRIARTAKSKGAGEFCLEWCFAQHPNIRIDTHADNATMISRLEKLGYTKCGIIRIDYENFNGDPRTAFQKQR